MVNHIGDRKSIECISICIHHIFNLTTDALLKCAARAQYAVLVLSKRGLVYCMLAYRADCVHAVVILCGYIVPLHHAVTTRRANWLNDCRRTWRTIGRRIVRYEVSCMTD